MPGKPQTGAAIGRAPGGAAPERLGLVEKYRTVVVKYEELVRRYNEGFRDRSSATTLALAALRASRNGLALYGRTGFLTRNARWFELASHRGRWSRAGAEETPAKACAPDGIEARAEALAGELLAGDGPGTRTALLARQEGPELLVELRLERVEAERKRLVIAIAEDVTERVRGEREIARAREAVLVHERMRLLGELASGVAHDLNNTLHALSLRIGHLHATPLDDRQRESMDVLARICADAAERVSRLQELGRRREDVPTESFDLSQVIREALMVARTEIDERANVHGVRFEIDTDLGAEVRAVGSPGELRHVFVNLLLNARDAMPRGGLIRISSRRVEQGAEVKVEDEGDGIPLENVERVFDPFFTTKGPMGMGLGLAIVQGVMRRLGGHVTAANRPGRGAVFTLGFPLAAPRAEEERPPREAPVPEGHRLLVVDDDLDNLEATRFVLEDLGQDVDLAASGEEALRLVADGRRYDLVLCDVGMPQMNGWQVAEALKRTAPETRVVLVTGWAQEIAPDDPRRRGVEGVLGKPLDVAQLRRALGAWLAPGPATR
jgi:signal transduction histidine kinase/CheY-like chemotaxis protein